MKLLGRRAECEALDRLLADVRGGESRVAVVRGDAGAGKSALLEYVADRAAGCHIVRAVGVESEMELPYSGLHQLCAPLLHHLEPLPEPQREALGTVFGLTDGAVPDRFLVGLATLTLFAEAAERQPLVCIVDDAQWLDQSSAQVIAFVARRLLAERVAIVCAARTDAGDEVLAGLEELSLGGLDDSDARALLLDNIHGPIDAAVCDQIVAESHGNPLALLELPRTWGAAELAGGFGVPHSGPIAGKIEQSYGRRLELLPAPTQLFVLTAAAEPLGDPVLLHRATQSLGVGMTAADAALDAGLIAIGRRVEFTHPLVRSAAYHSARAEDRHLVHRALADATDGDSDPDRRAWHRARAASGPDEEIAAELEQSAGRAESRGGIAAAAAFLERATALTVDPARRVERALAAAQIKYQAGSLDDALALLATASAGTLGEAQRARVLVLRARIAFASRRSRDARPLLLRAARDAQRADVGLARLIYLEALHAALHDGRMDEAGVLEVCAEALACPQPSAPHPRDFLLDGVATRIVHGYAAGAPILKQALAAFRREDVLPAEDAAWVFFTLRIASELWDDDSHLELLGRELRRAQESGALASVPALLETRAVSNAVAGRLDAAAAAAHETHAIGEALGIASHGDGTLLVAALRGREDEALDVVHHATEEAVARGEGLGLATAELARAILYNGLGRYELAVSAVRDAGTRPYELGTPVRATAELVEAAARTGDDALARDALERLTATTQAAGTPWALGVEARCRALLEKGAAADELYGDAIRRLAGTRLRPELARAHLLYGEWLRREGRRAAAREHLHEAHELLASMGMEAFAERARRELRATGEKVRKRTDEARGQLTPQEEQIARLAREGLSNPEIGAQLFISPRTVEWHLRKVFTKLGIGSRRELRGALTV